MDEKDKTIDHNMAGNKIIRFDVGIKRDYEEKSVNMIFYDKNER